MSQGELARSGERIGHIRLVEPLGEGGMGTVWAGFDEKLRREVAVKTLRADRIDLETRAHLLSEARLLSQLEHAGICRVYDYLEGEDSDYLILERIHGETLGDAVAQDETTDAERLRIGAEIADALAVAHARGIVHRDLKPSNIMLTDGGETCHREVKVLDFGIAHSIHRPESVSGGSDPVSSSERLVAPPIADGTLTRFASLILDSDSGRVTGTPANMSPEQARGEPPTPASDLYSFGLLLQELFTGAPAYPPDVPIDLLMVKAADGDTLPIEGVDREVKALIEDLLDVVPENRPTAAVAAARLDHIRRRPARRRRIAAAATLAFVALVAGVKYTFDLQRERNLAFAARQEAQEVADFLTGLFEASDAWSARDEEPTVRGLIDRGAGRIDRELADQPAVQARLLHTLGSVYASLRLYDEARPFLERALAMRRELYGDEHVEVAETLYELGNLLMDILDFETAGEPIEEALALRRQLLGDHPDVAESLDLAGAWHAVSGDWESAEELYRESLAMWDRLPEKPGDHGRTVINLAISLYNRGEAEEGVEVMRQGLASRRRLDLAYDPQLALIADRLALILTQRGWLDEAEDLNLESTEIWRRTLGADHANVALGLSNRATLLRYRGDLDAALAVVEEAAGMTKPVGFDICRRIMVGLESAKIRLELGDLAGTESILEELRGVAPACAFVESEVDWELARLQRARGNLPGAEAMVRRVLATWDEIWPAGNPNSLRASSMLGDILSERGQPEVAEPLLVYGYEGLLGGLGSRAKHTRDALSHLVAFYETYRPERAAEYRSRMEDGDVRR